MCYTVILVTQAHFLDRPSLPDFPGRDQEEPFTERGNFFGHSQGSLCQVVST